MCQQHLQSKMLQPVFWLRLAPCLLVCSVLYTSQPMCMECAASSDGQYQSARSMSAKAIVMMLSEFRCTLRLVGICFVTHR